MELQKPVVFITILLAATAGYCDTVTFVSASQLFSAHVTGNFIVFAYDIINHANISAWLKLISLPVFIIAVITGGFIAARSAKASTILLFEGILLSISGIAWMALSATEITDTKLTSYIIAMGIVFSMGLQNAFGKIYSKNTYGPTTMMTGNVTQAALDFGKILSGRFKDSTTKESLYHQSIIICSFLAGCLFGGLLGSTIGLSAVLLPGIALVFYAAAARLPEPTV
jgi:uncharacterized membrane protein YoaK (UPF0700 family)